MTTITATNRTSAPCGLLHAVVPSDAGTWITGVSSLENPVIARLHRFGRWCAILLEREVDPGDSVQLAVPNGARAPDLPPSFVVRTLERPRTPSERRVDPSLTLATLTTVSLPVAPRAFVPRTSAMNELAFAEWQSLSWCGEDDGPNGEQAAAWMWYHVDANTHRGLFERHASGNRWPWPKDDLDDLVRAAACDQLFPWLLERVSQRYDRAVARREGQRPQAPPPGWITPPSPAPERWLPHIACLLAQVFSRWCPGIETDQSLPRFANACSLFAAGRLELVVLPASDWHHTAITELTDRLSRGQPDSIALILFAELALAALDADLHPCWWSSALRAFIAMLEPFQLAYGTGRQRLKVDEYTDRCAKPATPIESWDPTAWLGPTCGQARSGLEMLFEDRLYDLLGERPGGASIIAAHRRHHRIP